MPGGKGGCNPTQLGELGKEGLVELTDLFVAGVDVGSLYTKVVILKGDHQGQQAPTECSHVIYRSGGLYKSAATTAMEQALKLAGLRLEDIDYTVSTGYGRYQLNQGHGTVTEISCHAYGAKFLFPDARTLIDIGGQDSRVIALDDRGGIANFAMNDKCAAGTGRFLEVMADGLGLSLQEMGELSLTSEKDLNISSVCTVFAETEIISLLSEGVERKEIAAAIYKAIANRIMGLFAHIGGVRERVAMSGGVAKSVGMVRALERKIGTTILIAKEPQVIGALGAALFALRQAREPDSQALGGKVKVGPDSAR